MERSSTRFFNGGGYVYGMDVLDNEGGNKYEDSHIITTVARYCVTTSVLEIRIKLICGRLLENL